MTLIVGAHPQNLSLSILSRRPEQVAALRQQGIAFFDYTAGAQTLPLVRLGVIQLAGTGATPPILAKNDGLDVVVFGMSAPRPENGGLVVRAGSSIKQLTDLAGHNIALMPISWHSQFLATELAAAGLNWKDVNAVDLLPATAVAAFKAGLLDALVVTDPLYSHLAASVELRLLARPGYAFSNRSVYWAPAPTVRDHPQAITALLRAVIDSDRATAACPQQAAQLLDGVNGTRASQWLPVLTARTWGVSAPDAGFLAEQQAHADIFARFGLTTGRWDLHDTVNAHFFPADVD